MKYLTYFLRFLTSFFGFIGIYTLLSVFLFGESVSGSELKKYMWIGAGVAILHVYLKPAKEGS